MNQNICSAAPLSLVMGPTVEDVFEQFLSLLGRRIDIAFFTQKSLLSVSVEDIFEVIFDP